MLMTRGKFRLPTDLFITTTVLIVRFVRIMFFIATFEHIMKKLSSLTSLLGLASEFHKRPGGRIT
jgi:hypothetical protein